LYSKDIYRILHPTAAEYTFFSVACGTCFKVDHILGHKANLNKCKKMLLTSCTLSDYNGIKLEINSQRNY
jgi:hypothetical protein